MVIAPTSPTPREESWSRFRYPSLFFLARIYDPEWDQFLRTALLANWVSPYFYGENALPHTDEWLSPHVAMFAGRQVWVANYPYWSCSIKPYDAEVNAYRPSREVLHYVQHHIAKPLVARKRAYINQQPTEN